MSLFETIQSFVHVDVVDQEPDGENRFVAALTTTLGSLLLLWERLEVQRELRRRRTVCPTLHKNGNALLGVFSVKTIACVHYWEVPCEFWWKKFIFTPIFTHLFWFFEFCSAQLFIGPRKTVSCYFVAFLAVFNRFWLEMRKKPILLRS